MVVYRGFLQRIKVIAFNPQDLQPDYYYDDAPAATKNRHKKTRRAGFRSL